MSDAYAAISSTQTDAGSPIDVALMDQLRQNDNQLRSEVKLSTPNGYGSINTKIRRFTTTVLNQGTDISYADSATLGALFTINTDGLYAIVYNDFCTTTAETHGITKNSAQLTTNIQSCTAADIVNLVLSSGTNVNTNCVAILQLAAGDLIRPHTDVAANNTDTRCFFRIVKISN